MTNFLYLLYFKFCRQSMEILLIAWIWTNN